MNDEEAIAREIEAMRVEVCRWFESKADFQWELQVRYLNYLDEVYRELWGPDAPR
jgi:hypothetical protein